MKNIYLFIIATVLFTSCLNTAKQSFNQEYKNDLSSFPDSMISHFPKEIQPNTLIKIESPDIASGCVYYMLFQKINDKILTKLDSLEMISVDKINPNDTTLITVKQLKFLKPDEIIKSYSAENKFHYPIPYFEDSNLLSANTRKDIYSNSSSSGLTEDFKIYVIQSKPGRYWEGELIPHYYMPKGWENGYSRGFCFSQKTKIIIYWVIIW